MPQLGESIAEATIVHLPFTVGEVVESGQDVMEVETQKAIMGVTSPCRGTIADICVALQQSYPVGAVLGHLDVSDTDAARVGYSPSSTKRTERHTDPSGSMTEPAQRDADGSWFAGPGDAAGGMTYLSPRMKARMNELGLHAADLSGIAGSGAAGRVTSRISRIFSTASTNTSRARPRPCASLWPMPCAVRGRDRSRPSVVPFRSGPCSRIARQADPPNPAPLCTCLRALASRTRRKQRAGRPPRRRKIVHPKAIDVGFAVESDDGVLVPVLRNADAIPLTTLLPRYDELVELARQRRLPASAQGGSIATVTNFGTFGLTWATPSRCPSKPRPRPRRGASMPYWDAEKSQFVPVVESDLTLSFDHRVLDAGAAGRLLAGIVEASPKARDALRKHGRGPDLDGAETPVNQNRAFAEACTVHKSAACQATAILVHRRETVTAPYRHVYEGFDFSRW